MEVTIGVYGMTCGHCQKRVADAVYFLIGWKLHRFYIIFKNNKVYGFERFLPYD
ncbi:MAG: hypothetical protein PHP71_10535 [Methanosarcina sp.]|nr:hypothetical protein [Methanosarcina sp.]